jgi:hypothetical protein
MRIGDHKFSAVIYINCVLIFFCLKNGVNADSIFEMFVICLRRLRKFATDLHALPVRIRVDE